MPIAVYALALVAFSIGTTEFIVSGILPAVSSDLAVSIPTAGLLVTAMRRVSPSAARSWRC